MARNSNEYINILPVYYGTISVEYNPVKWDIGPIISACCLSKAKKLQCQWLEC